MQIKNLIKKNCLISKVGNNSPIEVFIISISDNELQFKVRYNNGMESWLNINDYYVIDTLNKMTLQDVMESKNNDPLNKKVTMLYS